MAFRTHQGNNSRPPKQRYAPPRRRFALGRTKAITPNRPERAAIPRQKTPPWAPLQRFLPWLAEKRDYGGLSKHLEVAEKARKTAKRQKRQKAPNGAPECHTGPMPRGPPYRRFLPSCEQNRATAASRKEKPAKRYECLAGFPRRVEPVTYPARLLGSKRNREHSQPSFANPSSNTP